MKKDNGITIIALIIIIVVMLILLGVSTKVIIDSDIIKQTETIVDVTNNKTYYQEEKVNQLTEILNTELNGI